MATIVLSDKEAGKLAIESELLKEPGYALYRLIIDNGLPKPDYSKYGGNVENKERAVAQYIRRWRADFLWLPPIGVIVEYHGAIWEAKRGKHLRPYGFIDNVEKRNAANLLGWRLYEILPPHIKTGYALTLLQTVLDPASPYRPNYGPIRTFSPIVRDLTVDKAPTQPKKKGRAAARPSSRSKSRSHMKR